MTEVLNSVLGLLSCFTKIVTRFKMRNKSMLKEE